MDASAIPAGYTGFTDGRCTVVVRTEHEGDARAMVAAGGLHKFAQSQDDATPMQGRGLSYACRLPESGIRAVARHNRHGGLLAPLTRDLFFRETRAPYELDVALRLESIHVATPCVLMYSVTQVGGLWWKSDVVTREVESSRDLSTYMLRGEDAQRRRAAWEATHTLVWRMSMKGVRHHDLNVKNILLVPTGVSGELKAWLLDVDRVEFYRRMSPEILNNNLRRLFRSARKWRDERGAVFREREMNSLLRRTMP